MKGLTAILCDDEQAVILDLQKSISWDELGIEIIGTANDGKKAVELILKYQPDIAIIDIRMPGFNGLEAMNTIKIAGSKTEFIILSGYNEFVYAKEAIRLGAKAYLLKPLDTNEMYDTIYRICTDGDGKSNKRKIKQKLDNSFFRRLIDGNLMDDSAINVMLQECNLNIDNTSSFVIVIDTNSNDAFHVPYELLCKLDSTVSSERHYFYSTENGKIIGIFNLSNVIAMKIAENCLRVLFDQGIDHAVVGIGDVVPNLSQCSYSYNRAIAALGYRLYDKDCHIFTSENICSVPPSFRLTDLDYSVLIGYIQQMNFSGIEQYCGEFMDRVLYVKMPPPNFVVSTCYAFYRMVEQYFKEYTHEDYLESEDVGKIADLDSIVDINNWLVHSFTQLSIILNAMYGSRQVNEIQYRSQSAYGDDEDDTIRMAKEYIKKNISKDVRIETIAKQVHFSPKYFAVYFKNKTGVNLRDYLLSEKMKYAKKALIDTGISVIDLAYALGYKDYRSFSRAFKALNQITPSEFQSKYRR